MSDAAKHRYETSRIPSVTHEAVITAALKLPHKKRAELAGRLLKSLDELPEAEWEELWTAESERRLKNVREGRSKETPVKEVFARARALRSR